MGEEEQTRETGVDGTGFREPFASSAGFCLPFASSKINEVHPGSLLRLFSSNNLRGERENKQKTDTEYKGRETSDRVKKTVRIECERELVAFMAVAATVLTLFPSSNARSTSE
jgi:hypothetical protein